MAIKAIIFDFFGVLVVPGGVALHQDYPEHSQEISDLQRQSDFGIISHHEFNKLTSELLGLAVDDFVARYWHVNIRNEAVLSWVSELRNANEYKVGLLSNIGKGAIDSFIPADELAVLFDEAVLSSEVAALKPAPRAYEAISSKLGVLPEECVMIDDLAVNIDGAERAGMSGIVFQSADQAKDELERLLEAPRA